jgi:two-component system sensor histidine kinase KdpD
MESMTALVAQMMEREENAEQARLANIAVESQKMQRALLDNFQHEMHTPISVLSSALQHLHHDRQITPESRMILQEATIAVERLNLVVKDMTDLAQIECGTLSPSLEWCDTADFLQEWLDAKEFVLAENRIRLILPEKPVYIRIDTRLLNTALDNLFHNALRHAPAGSPVEIGAVAEGDRLRIEVADNGPGIQAEHRERIFERFFRGPEELPGGMGLGLPVARQFTELMGGSLTVASEPGKGAIFTMTFPCATQLSLAEGPTP